MADFAKEYHIRLLNSTPYYAQENGLAESTNKIVVSIIKKTIDQNPRTWGSLLSEALWAIRITHQNSIGTTPYAFTLGHDAVLPMEAPSLPVAFQNRLTPEEYTESMLMELEALDAKQMEALNSIKVNQARIARAYNKKVRSRTFEEGQLVWKLILPGAKPSDNFPRIGKARFGYTKCYRKGLID